MSSFLRLSIMVTALLLISACILTECGNPTPNPIIETLILRVQAQPSTYTSAGAQINYDFTVTNNGTSALAGPVTVTDNRMTVNCPNLNTIGNQNASLDPGESIICDGQYTTTEADVTAGSMTNTSRATVGSLTTAEVNTTIRVPPNPVLSLAITANPTTYGQQGQVITFSYTITNIGPNPLGPAQFVIQGDRIQSPLNCGQPVTLATNQTVTCSAPYTVTADDMAAPQVTHTATASGANAATAQSATITVARLPGTTTPVSTYQPGTTVRHPVATGEWMLQISRCYGANFEAVRLANPQVKDANLIYPFPVDEITVPNIGSVSRVYGPPCIKFYIVAANDTWQSIADAHNADLEVLMEANRNVTLAAGREIKVPLNSRLSGAVLTPLPPTAVSPRQPIRITFPAGSTTFTQTGTISTPDTIRYLLAASAGQILNVRLTVPTNDVSLAVYAPNGTPIKPLDGTTSWSGTLTASGDHAIDLVSTLGSTNKTYTLEVTLTTPAPPSPVERVADIHPGPGDSFPSHLEMFNGLLYFQANANDGTGAELWRYDRGLNAVGRVADINPGAGGSEPAYMTPLGEFLYFRANGNDGFGIELWRLNSSGATGRVTDLNPGQADSNPMHLAVFNGELYFSANGNDGTGVELWKYNGTVSTRAADINPGSGDSSPAYMTVFNNALYFSATSNDGAGTELWRFDGMTATRVADINEGVGNSNPAFLTVFNNVLYFSANGNDGSGTELWRFDGTTATLAADINPGAADSVPTYLTVFNNALYFSANGDAAGFELWRYDGTNASRVADINPAGNSNPAYLAVYNNELYFQANGNDGAGAELWRYRP